MGKKKTNKKLKTLTLFHRDNPVLVLCPGHVDKFAFYQAFVLEWEPGLRFKQEDLRYEYWRKTSRGYRKSVPGRDGAKPYTVADWD